MPTKSQHHPRYQPVPGLLRSMRENAKLTQRSLGDLLGVPQSWVYKCESAIRRVDVAEFAMWAEACGVEAEEAMRKLTADRKVGEGKRKKPR